MISGEVQVDYVVYIWLIYEAKFGDNQLPFQRLTQTTPNLYQMYIRKKIVKLLNCLSADPTKCSHSNNSSSVADELFECV